MNILQVFDLYSLTYGGGSVNIINQLTKALMQRGHQVTICTSDYKLDRNPAYNYKVYRSWLNLPNIRITPSVVSLDVKEFDVLHFHCYRCFMNAVLYSKAIKHGIPYVIDAHGSTVDYQDQNTVLRKIFDKVVGFKALQYGRLIAETEVGVEEYVRLGVPKEKVTLLHPMFDLDEFRNLPKRGLFREKYGIKGRVVLFLGRIHWAKGIEQLVKAVFRLENTKLVIVGQDDGYRAYLESLIDDYSIKDRVLFMGYLSGQDKLSALVDADVLVQSSKNEAGARPSLEAILCNTPVIVTRDNGAGREIATMDGGYLYDYGDIQQLTQGIRYVLENHSSTRIQTQKAKMFIEDNLSLEKQIVEYERLYGG